jgi:hypothetical protein
MRVLKVQIDIKLKWESHVRKIQKKMIIQMLVLTRLIVFTWEVCFKKIKHVYSVVIRSVITYDSSTWHASHERFDIAIALINKLIDLQKQKLRMMNDVFRVTLRQLLDVETQIQLIKLHLTYLQIKTRMRLQKRSQDALIINHCDKIKRKLTQSRKRRRRLAESTSSERKRSWFKNLDAEINEMILNEHVSTNRKLKKTLHKKWVKAYRSFLFSVQRYTWEHASRRENA